MIWPNPQAKGSSLTVAWGMKQGSQGGSERAGLGSTEGRFLLGKSPQNLVQNCHLATLQKRFIL